MKNASLLVLALCFLLLTLVEALTKKSYLVTTKDNTSLETFHSWIQKLDEGSGIQIVHEHVDHQSYVTDLTPDEADEVRKKSFIESVFEQGEPHEVRLSRAIPSSRLDKGFISSAQPSPKSPLEQRKVEGHGTLNTQMKMMSWNGMGRPPITAQYETDQNGGEGVDLHIIDTGFNVHLEELSGRDTKPITYFVPNELSMAEVPVQARLDASIEDRTEHGTMTSILAGGKTLGIAPKSHLYLYKYIGNYKNADGKIFGKAELAAYKAVTEKVISNINKANGRKAVVCMPVTAGNDALDDVFQSFIDELDNLGVTFVISAGNRGLLGKTTADAYPQRLGTPENNVITIGGLNYDGTLWVKTTPQGRLGSITAYNLAKGVTTMRNSGTIIPVDSQLAGTSYAAPITAGMIAVLLGIKKEDRTGVYTGINQIYDESGTHPSATKTKKYVEGLTFERSFDILQEGTSDPPYELPNELNAIYNGARGDPILC
ncbi:tri m 2 allergen [Penicillium capsulatum]|nr:tri m 2 allergen [Penicillium capsulatum]